MQWVPVGTLGKTHGLKGELKFIPEITDTELFDGLRTARIGGEDESAPPREIASLRGTASRLIIRFEGIDRIEDAQPLTGKSLLVPQDEFPPLPEGEHYWFEILGLEAYDDTGKFYGTVDEIIETGSNDVYVVREGSDEVLLPAIGDVIQSIDPEQNRLVFHVIDGLL